MHPGPHLLETSATCCGPLTAPLPWIARGKWKGTGDPARAAQPGNTGHPPPVLSPSPELIHWWARQRSPWGWGDVLISQGTKGIAQGLSCPALTQNPEVSRSGPAKGTEGL